MVTTNGSLLAGTEAREDAMTDFLHSAPLGWERLENWEKNIEVKGVVDEKHAGRQLRTASVHYISCVSGIMCLESRTGKNQAPLGGKTLWAANSRYGFWLSDKAGPSELWVLRMIQTGDTGPSQIQAEIQKRYYFATNPQSHIDPDATFRSTLNDPKFHWQRAERVHRDGKEMIKVSFARTREFQGVQGAFPYEGHYVFDPSNSWACVEAYSLARRREKGIPNRVLLILEYSNQAINGIRPMLKYRSYSRWDDAGPMESEKDAYHLIFDVNDARMPSADASAFRLTGYGLPEPVGQTFDQARSRLWLWLLCGAVLCAAVAIAVIRSRRNRKDVVVQ